MMRKDNKDECLICGRKVNKETAVFVEVDFRDNSINRPGDVPDEFSQGGFYVGPDCAKKIVYGDAR